MSSKVPPKSPASVLIINMVFKIDEHRPQLEEEEEVRHQLYDSWRRNEKRPSHYDNIILVSVIKSPETN